MRSSCFFSPRSASALLTFSLAACGAITALPAHAQSGILTVGQDAAGNPGPGSATITDTGSDVNGTYNYSDSATGSTTFDPTVTKYLEVNVNGSDPTSAQDHTLTVSGGQIGYVTDLYGTVQLSGGAIQVLTNYGGPVTISGGTLGQPFDLSQVVGLDNYGMATITGGTIWQTINEGTGPAGPGSPPTLTFSGATASVIANFSTATFSGGTVNALTNNAAGTVNITAGAFRNITATDTSQTTVSGGTVADFATGGSSTATLSGGAFTSSINALDNSVITLSGGTFGAVADGSGLEPAGTVVPTSVKTFGSGVIDLLGNNLTESLIADDGTYTVSGILLNNTSPFTFTYSDYTDSGMGLEFNNVAALPGGAPSFAPVPEMSTGTDCGLLLAVSGLGLGKLRKKRMA